MLDFVKGLILPGLMSLIAFVAIDQLGGGLWIEAGGVLVTFLVTLEAENWFSLRAVGKETRERAKRLSLKHPLDEMLVDIQQAYHELVDSSPDTSDLFLRFYDRRISELRDHIVDANNKGELRIDVNHHYMTDTVLEVFDNNDTNEIREIWRIEPDDQIFDAHALNYLVKTTDLIIRSKIKSYQSLFVCSDGVDTSAGILNLLLSLHHHNAAMSYRVISESSFLELQRDATLRQEYIDFAIYGQRLIFRTSTYTPHTTGSFGRNADVIERYTNFFEGCWNSAHSKALKHDGDQKTTVQDIVTAAQTEMDHQ